MLPGSGSGEADKLVLFSLAGLINLRNRLMKTLWNIIGISVFVLSLLAACTHTVQLEAPEKPITINLNVKIEHEIRVKVDKELDSVFSKDSGLF